MEQLEGFIVHGQESKVCKLDKSLYGLKQAPKQWHEKFDNLLMPKGFKVSESDKCIYYKTEDQSHYIEKILKKYNYFDSKPACTPYDSSVKLFKNTGDSVDQTEYASIIGSLRYSANCTRPHIAYAVGLLCYNDADWNSLSDDSKTASGYIFNIVGEAVAWKSKKQTILAQSTMESAMIALTAASEEASWLGSLLSEISTLERLIPAILIHYDSTAAITKVQNCYYNGKRRQIHRKHSTLRELLTTGAVIVDYVRSDDNLADPLTKDLLEKRFLKPQKEWDSSLLKLELL
ncbi:putative Polyprotein [Cucumis melo var. makuwa]|uniref:Polyprotein n=1 Tax=Cucumis melo var. makuwa TaxID=1194695 RepID=A0A5A7TCT6_CUCMM|nr:putative Polyprotein [Cucumis melo var. makuwa]TYK16068.1 putative Polyprotein [Cucumis melo var. makuwa]